MTSTSNTLVTIVGGSGFLGRHIVQVLAKRGYRIRAAVRHPELAGHLQPLGMVGQIQAVQGNVRYPASIAAACKGAQTVINLTGILYETGRQTFEAIHVLGAEAVAKVAHVAGATQLIHVSAIGADPASPSAYARTKAEGEVRVRAAFPEATILRPSVVFGPEDQFLNLFAAMARVMPVLPLIGGGRTRMQPVYVGDIARAVGELVDRKIGAGTIYELGGPEILTLREIFEYVLKTTHRRRLLMPIPFSAAKLQATFLQMLPKPLLTTDQVTQLQYDNVVSADAARDKRTFAGLGIVPQALEAIVPQYLERFRPTGSYDRGLHG
ncbi:complex I NDUFA9 subunit family protein [Rhodoligotrophos defluvii]|uniref:complex I NDUFA9 subunit family protein n=1 Tax=Rhodoligotrophos defluvii TaxID=2561934 RepID=UPI0010CA13C6|nr:complex I NDUFA9 subunit family protein [Rhodoligotrophos defluvii]